MKTIEVMTSDGPVKVSVIKENSKTWLVKLPDGNIIKRHKIKHAVK